MEIVGSGSKYATTMRINAYMQPTSNQQPDSLQRRVLTYVRKYNKNVGKLFQKTTKNGRKILPDWVENRGNRSQGVPQRGDKKRK